MYENKRGEVRKAYRTDLTDAEWNLIEPVLPPANPRPGYKTTDLREVVNTLLYQNRTGCQWDLLPHDLPPKSTVFDYYKRWSQDGTWQRVLDALRSKARLAEGKEATPSMIILDSQSARSSPGGGEQIGTDGGKKVKGRKRHIAVDTMGFVMAVVVTAANVSDGRAAPALMEQIPPEENPRLQKILGDGRYHDTVFESYLKEQRPELTLEVTGKPAGSKGFKPIKWRWVVERTFAWLLTDRRLSRDYERHPWSSEARLRIAAIGKLIHRVTRRSKSEIKAMAKNSQTEIGSSQADDT